MVEFPAKNPWWTRRFRCAAFAGLTCVSLFGPYANPVSADLFPHPKIPKPVENEEPQKNSGFDNAIRKLLKEAKSAEKKGELDRALILAERAAKISEASTGLVTPADDVSPAAMTRYAKELRMKIAELAKKQRPAETPGEPVIVKLPPSPRKFPPKVADKPVSKPSSEIVKAGGNTPNTPREQMPREDKIVLRSRFQAAADDQRLVPPAPTNDEVETELPAPTETPRRNANLVVEMNSANEESSEEFAESDSALDAASGNTAMTTGPETVSSPAIRSKDAAESTDIAESPKSDVISDDQRDDVEQPVATSKPSEVMKPAENEAVANKSTTLVAEDLAGSSESRKEFRTRPIDAQPGSIAPPVSHPTNDLVREEPIQTETISRIRKLRPRFREALPEPEKRLDMPATSDVIEIPTEEPPESDGHQIELIQSDPAEPETSMARDEPVSQPEQAVTTSDEKPTSITTTPSAPTNSGSFKLRPSFRETQSPPSNRSIGDDDGKTTSTEAPAEESAPNVKASLATQQELNSSDDAGPKSFRIRAAIRGSFARYTDAAPQAPSESEPQGDLVVTTSAATEAEPTDPAAAPSGSFKLRPAFIDPQFKASSGNQPQTESVRKPVVGHTSVIHWRSAGSAKEGVGSEGDTTKRAQPDNRSVREAGMGNGSIRSSSETSDAAASTRQSGNGAAESVSPSQKKRAERALRGSPWDNASAPSTDAGSSGNPSAGESTRKAPLPPQTDRVIQTSMSVSSLSGNQDPGQKASVASDRSAASKSGSDVAATDSPNSDLPSASRNTKLRPGEDDQAESTRAVLSNGPVQRLARLAGVPQTTASAMLAAFGVTTLIAGLWMVRATLKSNQS